MAKPDLGKKLSCPSCGAKFYDLNKTPAVCPKCETKVEAQPLLKPKRGAPVDEAKAKPKTAPVAKAADPDEIELDGDGADDIELDDEDDDLIEDTSDLEEEDDEMSEVKEHLDGEEEDLT